MAAVEQSISGFFYFIFKSKGLAGGDLFHHMVQKKLNDPKIKSHEPSVYLDLSLSKEQVKDFVPGKKYLWNFGIMRFTNRDGANMKLSMIKLNNVGYINSYGCVQNDPERLHRLKCDRCQQKTSWW